MSRKIVRAAVFSFLAGAAYVAWLRYEGERASQGQWVEISDPIEPAE